VRIFSSNLCLYSQQQWLFKFRKRPNLLKKHLIQTTGALRAKMLKMKTTSLLLFLVILILGFPQQQINNYLSIEKNGQRICIIETTTAKAGHCCPAF